MSRRETEGPSRAGLQPGGTAGGRDHEGLTLSRERSLLSVKLTNHILCRSWGPLLLPLLLVLSAYVPVRAGDSLDFDGIERYDDRAGTPSYRQSSPRYERRWRSYEERYRLYSGDYLGLPSSGRDFIFRARRWDPSRWRSGRERGRRYEDPPYWQERERDWGWTPPPGKGVRDFDAPRRRTEGRGSDRDQEPVRRREGRPATYTVVRGDSLWRIAQRYYKDGSRWKEIWWANRDQIRNPNLIYPGQVFVIPGASGDTSGSSWTLPVAHLPSPSLQQRLEQEHHHVQGGQDYGAGRLDTPLTHGRITSDFGPRWGSVHRGIDIAVPTGTPVLAAAPGRVTHVGWSGGYGRLVKVQHPDGRVTYYAHLLDYNVREGQYVRAGQRVARSNDSGKSTGPHLHFGVQRNGRFEDPRDSVPFPRKGGRF